MNSLRSRLATSITKFLGPPSAAEFSASLISKGNGKVAIDIGCGINTPLRFVPPSVFKIGIDVDARSVEEARRLGLHDAYLVTNIMTRSVDELKEELLQLSGGQPVDTVILFSVIEHLPKREGFDLLNLCESITSRYVIVETPNGFVPQGPEFGNPFQRHLSGWFPEDFSGLGYSVFGTGGTNVMRGYMGTPRINFPGIALFDLVILSRLLRTFRSPRFAFNLVAVKDVRGVPARYENRDHWHG